LAVSTTTILSGAALVLPDRLLSSGFLVVEDGVIVDVGEGRPPARADAAVEDLTGSTIVPGFIDVHVHGIEGLDTQQGGDVIDAIARRLTRYGVTAFCPTSIACDPPTLTGMLDGIREARATFSPGAARVLSAHLESNFINPDYRGAQPIECIRRPPRLPGAADTDPAAEAPAGFSGDDIYTVIDDYRDAVGIVTLAPEMPGALDLTRALVASGIRVSLGHSGATYEEAMAGVEAGARHATHLFNRMTPLGHREPGLTGAVLASEVLAAEIICDGFHVHPSVVKLAIQLKRPERTMAITDGTAGSGLPVGSRVTIGGRPITVTPTACFLDDGTLAGSALTMDRAFALLVQKVGCSLVDAAMMCATTQARELGMGGEWEPRVGALLRGTLADLAVLDRDLRVVRTYVGGRVAFAA